MTTEYVVSGFGVMPSGGSPFGVGEADTAQPRGGALLVDVTTGASTGSRRIDQNTRDYVVDGNGRLLGMNDTTQLVLVAVMTELNSSAMPNLGQDLGSIKVIGVAFERRVASKLAAALSHLTSRKLIAIVSINVIRLRTPGAASIRLRWRDIATQTVHSLEI